MFQLSEALRGVFEGDGGEGEVSSLETALNHAELREKTRRRGQCWITWSMGTNGGAQ